MHERKSSIFKARPHFRQAAKEHVQALSWPSTCAAQLRNSMMDMMDTQPRRLPEAGFALSLSRVVQVSVPLR